MYILASYILAKFSDFWYNEYMTQITLCEHVYKEMKQDICPNCGRDTHKTNWQFQHELHRDWIASGKAQSQGWTSI